MADEEIIIKYVVMADEAIDKTKQMSEATERAKAAIRSLAADAKTSFKAAADTLKDAIKNLSFGDVGATKKLSDLLGIDESTINSETKFAQARTQALKTITVAATALGQEERAQINATRKAQQEYVQITRQGYGEMSEGAKAYGREVDAVKSQILNGATSQRQSFQDVADGMAQAGVSTKLLNQALIEIAQEEKANATLRKKSIDEQKAAQKNYEQVTISGYGKMTEAGQQFGQVVKTIKTQIQAQSQASGKTYKEIAADMAKAGVSALALDTAVKMLNLDEQQFARTAMEYDQISRQGYGMQSAAVQAYGQQVQAVTQSIKLAAQTTGQTFTQVAQQIQQAAQQIQAQSAATGQPYTQVAQQMAQAGANANVLNAALGLLANGATTASQQTTVLNSSLKNLNTTGKQTQNTFATIGGTILQALAVGLGINLYNMIQQTITALKEMAQAGFELQKAFFQLDVGIRAVRRAGMNIATPEMLANLDKLSDKFGVFSRKSLVEGSAALINLIRDMGMTKEQVFELQDAIATLAIVNGRSMDEVQKTVALALSSGYTEGLQRLGVSINRVNIAARANAMGWKGGYTALTEHQRAMATLSLIMEKTGKYADDLTKYLATEAGQLDVSTASLEDQSSVIGTKLVPALIAWNNIMFALKGTLGQLVDVFAPVLDALALLTTALNKFDEVKFAPRDERKQRWVELLQVVDQGLAKIAYKYPWFVLGGNDAKVKEEMVRRMKERYNIDLAGLSSLEVPVGTPDLSGEGEDKLESQGKDMMDYVMELHHDIEKEQLRFNQRMKELEIDLARDLEKIEIERDRDLRDLYEEYIQDRLDIAEEGAKKITEAEAEYARKVVDANRDYNNKVAEANRKYQNEQIDAEKKFQEEMRKLREEFLFDLEGALEQRDARQVLNLIRRYNLDRTQAQRGYALDQEERARQHQLEMEELARERDERLRQLAEEHALKIAQIKAETAERLAERQKEYEREKADRIQKAEEDKQDRRNQFLDQIDDLKLQYQQRMEELAFELSSEKDMTADLLSQIAAEYAKTYGPGGAIDQYLSYYIGLLSARASQAASIMSQLQSYSKFYYPTYSMNTQGYDPGASNMYYRAEGGIMYADKPTHVVFGEAGLEKAEFTPISRAGKNTGKVVSGSELSGNDGAKGNVAIRVSLSPELIGQIEENTLNQAAEVLLEVQRRVR